MSYAEIHGVKLIKENDMVVRSYENHNNTFEDISVDLYWKLTTHICGHSETQIAIDVGAYTGLYSLIAAQSGCRVIAYEPQMAVFNRMCENIRLNKSAPNKITLKMCAVSDVRSVVYMTEKPGTPLTSGSMVKQPKDDDHVSVLTVNTVTLDEDIDSPDHKNVGIIKIDVEGHELNVLKGAKSIIDESAPILIVEALTQEERIKIENYMKQVHNYGVIEVDGRNLILGYSTIG